MPIQKKKRKKNPAVAKVAAAAPSASPDHVAATTGHVCGVRASGGSVTVRLLADHMLAVGGDFKLLANDKVIEQWKMSAGNNGSADHTLATPTSKLDDTILRFQLLVCSPTIQISEGNIDVQYLQNAVTCPCSPPTHWSLTEVPFCGDDTVVPITSRVLFDVN